MADVTVRGVRLATPMLERAVRTLPVAIRRGWWQVTRLFVFREGGHPIGHGFPERLVERHLEHLDVERRLARVHE